MTDRVTFIVHLPAKPETRERFERLLLDVLKHCSGEDHFVECHVHRSQDDPNLYVLHETWSCSKQYFLENYLNAAYREEYVQAAPDLLSKPMSIEFLDTVVSIPRRQGELAARA
jgi:quinol monooxygenase YgiN